MALCFIMNLMFDQFLKKFWPLFNAMQLLSVLVVMDVPCPTNVTMVLNEVHYALSFDVVRELHEKC